MSRILRYFFIGILSVVAVVALCVGVLVNIFDPNDYKERIQSEVKSQTGSNLLLEGEISYTVFPTIGLSIPHIELSKNQRAGEPLELSVDNLSFGLNVLGLLSKSIEFSGRADRIVFVKPAQTETSQGETTASPIPPAEGTESASTETQPSDSDRLIPTEVIRELPWTLEGQLEVAEINAQGLELRDTVLGLTFKEKIFTASPFRTHVSGGQIDGSVGIDFSSAKPLLGIDLASADIDIGSLLKALEISDLLEGYGSMRVALSGEGETADDIKSSLNGVANIELRDGALSGFDIQGALISIQEVFKGDVMTWESRPGDKTRFAELSADFTAENGVLTSKNLSMKAPAIRLKGQGLTDLPKEAISYALSVSVVNTLEGQGGASLEKLKGLTIPFTISGPIMEPSFGMDVSAVAAELAKKEVQDKVLDALGASSLLPGGDGTSKTDAGSEESLIPTQLLESLGGSSSGSSTQNFSEQPTDSSSKANSAINGLMGSEAGKQLFKSLGLD